MSEISAEDIFERYESGQLPDTGWRRWDGLNLMDLGWEMMFGLGCLDIRSDYAKAVQSERLGHKNDVAGRIGPMVLVGYDPKLKQTMVSALPGTGIWRLKGQE